jgi:hypothetical protein
MRPFGEARSIGSGEDHFWWWPCLRLSSSPLKQTRVGPVFCKGAWLSSHRQSVLWEHRFAAPLFCNVIFLKLPEFSSLEGLGFPLATLKGRISRGA